MNHHLAQINVGRMLGSNIEDPIMKEFVDNLDHINGLAESSPGFVWRLKDETNNASHFNPYDDKQIIINLSVWENIDSLKEFTFRTLHAEYLKRRKEWFQAFGKPHFTMWWIAKGHIPTIEEAVDKLACYQKQGPTSAAFDFKRTFEPEQ